MKGYSKFIVIILISFSAVLNLSDLWELCITISKSCQNLSLFKNLLHRDTK